MYFHYHAKFINAERVGSRLVRVACARCGCEYFYEFTRIGFGSSQAPYGIGVDRATRSANLKAQKQLERRLAAEAELVPCPQCHWINDELVAGFRRGSYGRLTYLAGFITKAGVVIGVVTETILAIVEPTLLLYGLLVPLAVFLVSGAIVLLRSWLCSRIRPNRDYPQPPQLPPASPPALVLDPTSNDLVPATVQRPPIDDDRDWCDFQIGRHTAPLVCCDCLQPLTLARAHAHALEVGSTLKLKILCCADCADSNGRRARRIWWNGIAVGILASAAIVIPLNLDWLEFGIASVVLVLASIAISGFVARRLTAPAKIVARDRPRGVVRVRFQNVEYARAVVKHLGA